MKSPQLCLSGILLLVLGGCSAPQQVALAPTAAPHSAPVQAPPLEAPSAPTATPRIIQLKRSSLPPLPQMMDPSVPRPTFIPLPTSTPRPIPAMEPTPTPRQNQTIIVSNAPVAGNQITPQDAAARELVWVNADSQIYHRPGSRFYGATQNGYYLTETQAQARGLRASKR